MKSYLKRHWIECSVIGIVVIILLISFVRFYLQGVFTTYDFVPCDPALHQCFVSECTEDDPRCSPYVNKDGMYYFAIQEHTIRTANEYYCDEAAKESFGNLVLDPTCSE